MNKPNVIGIANGRGYNRKTYKIYDYTHGVQLDDKRYNDAYVTNVPCYSLDDVYTLLGTQCHQRVNEIFGNVIDIQTQNHKGKKFHYILATPECDKMMTEKGLFAMIAGNIKKMPKRHNKIVRVIQRGHWHTTCYKFKKPPLIVDAYTCDKWDSIWIENAVKDYNNDK